MPFGPSLTRLLGRYSEGFRLIAEHGVTSGAVQEYAYRNQAQGRGVLGKVIDRMFLQVEAWDALRQHIQATRKIVEELLQRRESLGLTTTVLDIASGTAPYLREIARGRHDRGLTIVCHDRDPRKVTLGRELIRAEGLKCITFSVGDATDPSSYLTSRDPDVILAINLFPWFEREEAIRKTLQLAHRSLAAGGCLVCSTLTRDRPHLRRWQTGEFGKPPVLRNVEKMSEWLTTTGFGKIEVRPAFPDGAALLAWKQPAAEAPSPKHSQRKV